MIGTAVVIQMDEDDARALFDALGARPVNEAWSTRLYVELADLLGEHVPNWMRVEATPLASYAPMPIYDGLRRLRS